MLNRESLRTMFMRKHNLLLLMENIRVSSVSAENIHSKKLVELQIETKLNPFKSRALGFFYEI